MKSSRSRAGPQTPQIPVRLTGTSPIHGGPTSQPTGPKSATLKRCCGFESSDVISLLFDGALQARF